MNGRSSVLRRFVENARKARANLKKQSSIPERDVDTDTEDRGSSGSLEFSWRDSKDSGNNDDDVVGPICLSPEVSDLDFSELIGFPMQYLLLVSTLSTFKQIMSHLSLLDI